MRPNLATLIPQSWHFLLAVLLSPARVTPVTPSCCSFNWCLPPPPCCPSLDCHLLVVPPVNATQSCCPPMSAMLSLSLVSSPPYCPSHECHHNPAVALMTPPSILLSLPFSPCCPPCCTCDECHLHPGVCPNCTTSPTLHLSATPTPLCHPHPVVPLDWWFHLQSRTTLISLL